jgi:hypothetical protein
MQDRVHDADKQPPARSDKETPKAREMPREIGGAKGPEPTRYGDWQHNGRCTDF